MIPTAMIPTAMTLAAMTLSRLDAAAARLLDVLWRGSWQAAVLAGLVLAAQLALRSRLSARWRYKLWAVVILRLLIPVTPASPLSVFNLLRTFHAPAMATIPAAPPASSGAGDLGGVPSAAPLAQVDAAKPQAASRTIATIPPPLLRRWYLVIASAWFFGMLALLARVALATWRLSRAVARMPRLEDARFVELLRRCRAELDVRRTVELRCSPDLAAPALTGVLRPRILLPAHVLNGFAAGELRLILLHELGHLKRHDVAANWLLALLQAVHWFNPVLWLAFARVRADRELACDELVLSAAAPHDNDTYGRTIVKLLQGLSVPRAAGAMPAAAGTVGILEDAHASVRRRIVMITQFTRRSATGRTGTAVALVSLLALGALGLTDAVRGEPATKPAADPAAAAAGRSQPLTRPAPASGAGGTLELSGGNIGLRDTRAGTEIRADRVVFTPGGAAVPSTGPAAAEAVNDAERTYAQFQRRLPEVKFDAIPLSDVVDFLRDVTGHNLVLNSRALENAGVDKNAPVTLRLRDATLEQVLRQVLQQAGAGSAALAFGVEGNGIVIAPADAVPTRVRAYDVSELVSTATTRPGSEGIADATKTLVELVKENVATDSWRENGGTIGTISSFGGKLVISTTDMNHLQIDRLLAELRSPQAAAAAAAAAAHSAH